MDKIKSEFKAKVEEFLNRIKINHIVCFAPISNGKSWSKKDCDEYLKDPFHKIPINNLFLLNDHNNPKIKLQQDEYTGIHESLKECSKWINEIFKDYCTKGENLYELNECMQIVFKSLDENILVMNYDSWNKEIYGMNREGIYFLLFGTAKVEYGKLYIDIKTHCMTYVSDEFSFRKALIYELKYLLIDIYSKYMILPTTGIKPKFEYDGNPIDICELILAISSLGKISDFEKVKAILLDMFGISRDVYTNSSHSIRNRLRDKSVFVQKLSDMLDNMPSSKNKTKGAKKILPKKK